MSRRFQSSASKTGGASAEPDQRLVFSGLMTKLMSHQIDENIKPTQSKPSDFFVNAFICPQYFENESVIFIKDSTSHGPNTIIRLYSSSSHRAAVQVLAPKTIYDKQPKRWLLNYKCIVCNLTNAHLGVAILKTSFRHANVSLHHVHCGLGGTGKQRRWWNFTSESDDASAPRKKTTNVNNLDKVNRIVFTDTNTTEFI